MACSASRSSDAFSASRLPTCRSLLGTVCNGRLPEAQALEFPTEGFVCWSKQITNPCFVVTGCDVGGAVVQVVEVAVAVASDAVAVVFVVGSGGG